MFVLQVFRNRILLLALLFGSVLPTTISWLSGNLGIPHNDAWAYSRIAQEYALTGQIQLLGWNRASLVGQFIPFQELFQSLKTQHVVVSLFSIILILSVYQVLRNYVSDSQASVGALIIAVWPGYALLSTSFMSDVPTMSTTFLALALAHKSINKDNFVLLGFSLVIGFWSFSMREQALAAPIAIIIWAFLYYRKTSKARILQIGILTLCSLLVIIVFQLWRAGLPNSDPASFEFRTNGFFVAASGFTRAYFEFALVIVPAAVLVGARPRINKLRILVAFLILALGVFQYSYAGVAEFFLPNYLSISGSYSSVLPPTANVFPEFIWTIVIFSSIALGILAIFLLPDRKPPVNLISIFSALVVLGTSLQFLIDQGVFSRYLIPIAPYVFYLLVSNKKSEILKIRKTKFKILNAYVLVCVTSLSLGLMAHSYSFDRARWEIATHISENGLEPMQVDAGLEWLGWHSPNGVVGNVRKGSDPGKYWGFNVLFENNPCFVLTQNKISEGDETGLTSNWYLVDQIVYKKFLAFGESRLNLYETFHESCLPNSNQI